ncbi:c-type cytochrome [Pseudomonas sp.]|jgi:cytochrome c553|uniref:c-type cytochrome n=1 Tax=Pseudomonas sp. TaxID=306 RepID=UPI002730CB70|nr:c-type cytochrome [Pseudomonas sp.]MDP2244367.1 c-type cytochrome [Pseudomonas sp.]
MRVLALVFLCCIAGLAQASDEAMQRFTQLNADPALREQAYAAGQERIRFCGHCHGENGNSKRAYIPNLAEQNPVYLFNAFEKFASGERKDFVMSQLAPSLTLEDRVNVAIYFGQQKLLAHSEPVDAALQQQGEVTFKTVCTGCHGVNAEGRDNTPRLAGQPAEYLRKALTRFRDQDPSRAGSVMMSIAANFNDAQIGALAVYLQQLQP